MLKKLIAPTILSNSLCIMMMEQASRRVGITGISHILLIRLLRVEKDTTVAFPICNIVFADTHSRHRNTILQTAHQENGGK